MMRHRLTIQERSGQADATGQLVDQWQDVTTVWAAVAAATGKEVYSASGFSAQTSHTARIRFQPSLTITTAMRALHDGKALRIQGVSDEDGTRRFLTLALLQIDEGSPNA